MSETTSATPFDQLSQPRPTPTRIGVLTLNLEAEAAVNALRYLILHLNRLQQYFEYELLPSHATGHPLLEMLEQDGDIERATADGLAWAFPGEYSRKLKEAIEEYDLSGEPPEHFIILSRARFADGYYSTGTRRVAIVALGHWETAMAPPSIVEFFLTLPLRESAGQLCPALDNCVHLGTKGCLFDFSADLSEVRLKVLHAFVCHVCRQALDAGEGTTGLADALVRTSENRWLGQSTDPSSPASIVSKLGYDLFLTKGLRPTWRESLTIILQQDGTKELLRLVTFIVGTVLATAAVFFLGLKKQ